MRKSSLVFYVTMAVSCIISEIKRAIGRKSVFLYHLHSTPTLGESLSKYCHTVSYGNKNLAIANRSRVSCAHNSSRVSIGLITHDLEI